MFQSCHAKLSHLKQLLKNIHLMMTVMCVRSNKPSLQIVLWKPPGDFVRDLVCTSHEQQQPLACDSDDDDDNNDVMTDDSVTSRSLTEQRVTSLAADDEMDL